MSKAIGHVLGVRGDETIIIAVTDDDRKTYEGLDGLIAECDDYLDMVSYITNNRPDDDRPF